MTHNFSKLIIVVTCDWLVINLTPLSYKPTITTICFVHQSQFIILTKKEKNLYPYNYFYKKCAYFEWIFLPFFLSPCLGTHWIPSQHSFLFLYRSWISTSLFPCAIPPTTPLIMFLEKLYFKPFIVLKVIN